MATNLESSMHYKAKGTIKPTRKSSALYAILDIVVSKPGITRGEIADKLEQRGFTRLSDSVAVTLSWHIPLKGYAVNKEGIGASARYWITNANQVV